MALVARIRTCNLFFTRELLYRWSYTSKPVRGAYGLDARNGADRENRTLVLGLEDLSSTIELYPHIHTVKDHGRGAVNRTPDFLIPNQAPSHWATPR